MKVLVLLTLAMTSTAFAGATLKCDNVYGESVYSEFTLETPFESETNLPYELTDYLGQNVVLEGKPNPNHPDRMDGYEDWSFVTPGKRVATIKKDDSDGEYFSIETCQDCDFNGASYEYKMSNEGELFITEMYGSDGSGEFSVYSCQVK